MQEFKVNEFITLRLEGRDTVIYVAGERFQQCKYLLITIPIDEVIAFDEIQSIDEAEEQMNKSVGQTENPIEINISSEVEFWAHCSNLQVWSENGYNTNLLHSNIAFPLLKGLTEVGDRQALRVFKEEIARRIESGYKPVIKFLWNEGYIRYLSKEDFSAVLHPNYEELNFIFEIEDHLNVKFYWAEDRLDADEEGPAWFSMREDKIVNLEISYIPKIDQFPESITKLKHLIDVRMIEDSIKFVPESIGNLTQLQYLDLTGNKIEEIPLSIGNCKKLEVLKLRSNRINILPESIGNLILLKELDLTNNSFKFLPESIGKLTILKKLDLGENNLKTLPSSMHNLKSIKFLRLDPELSEKMKSQKF